ncbi:ribonuclease T1 [Antricoccus suffuscus]|uniref:Ribonuclease T1 n=1 Tax=Antricoccus suffuscus TaxID=1629062 RepID=A0A2T0Z4X7_9ACTN|nr:ribonuclease domain-containing protein [Antricoccus suffuscus]PRZ31395.1 ribonuclease T1 [Antricoccus suffuscus]
MTYRQFMKVFDRLMRRKPAAAVLVVVGLVIAGFFLVRGGTTSDGPEAQSGVTSSQVATDAATGASTVALSALPKEAAQTLKLIKAGGPFPYEKDGSTFGNFEKLLPLKSGGYYHEYTVPTPGESDRGARRIIAGDGGEFYYTGDHYASFQRIEEDS